MLYPIAPRVGRGSRAPEIFLTASAMVCIELDPDMESSSSRCLCPVSLVFPASPGGGKGSGNPPASAAATAGAVFSQVWLHTQPDCNRAGAAPELASELWCSHSAILSIVLHAFGIGGKGTLLAPDCKEFQHFTMSSGQGLPEGAQKEHSLVWFTKVGDLYSNPCKHTRLGNMTDSRSSRCQ